MDPNAWLSSHLGFPRGSSLLPLPDEGLWTFSVGPLRPRGMSSSDAEVAGSVRRMPSRERVCRMHSSDTRERDVRRRRNPGMGAWAAGSVWRLNSSDTRERDVCRSNPRIGFLDAQMLEGIRRTSSKGSRENRMRRRSYSRMGGQCDSRVSSFQE